MKNVEKHPNRTVECDPQFIPSDHGEMLLGVMTVAEGSIISGGPTEGKQLDAVRGMLIFYRNEYSYHVHMEMVGSFGERLDVDEVKRRTLALYERTVFHD
jgi:hypothetical protein